LNQLDDFVIDIVIMLNTINATGFYA